MDLLLCEIQNLSSVVQQWAQSSMREERPDQSAQRGAPGDAGRSEPVQRFFRTEESGELAGRSGRREEITVHNASDGTLLLRIDDSEEDASLRAYTVAIGPGEHYVSEPHQDVSGRITFAWVTLPYKPAPPAGVFLEATGGWLMYSATGGAAASSYDAAYYGAAVPH